MATIPLPPSGVTFIDPITGGVSVIWQNYLLLLSSITGTFAPVDAEYWVSTSNSDLTNETNLGSLTSGYMKLTVAAAVGTPSTVASIPGGDVTGAALSRTNDTNVTLTLGGTPLTALLRATSLTLGWTGMLAVSRGGIGVGTLAAHGVLVGNGTSAVSVTGTGSAGQVLTSNGAAADPTFQAPATSGTVTSVAMTVPGGFSISGSPVTTSGTLALAANGTSGGVPYYSGSTSMASSGQLAANSLVKGNGAGNAPSTDGNWTLNSASYLNSATQPRCSAYNSSAQSVTHNTFSAVALDTEDFDVGGLHDTVTNNSRMTIPTSGDGLYQIMAAVYFDPNATGTRLIRIYKNGTALSYGQAVVSVNDGTNGTGLTTSLIASLVATDYIECYAFQTSGAGLNISNSAQGRSLLQIVKLW